jgi:hypothetical protein
MGAPFDSLYRFDLISADPRRYQLLFMVNLFTMDRSEADRVRNMMEGSGVTVVWYYAPGFIAPDRFDPGQMERLTGFRFEILNDPGPMQIRVEKTDETGPTVFGTSKPQKPRFAVLDTDVQVLGRWIDNGRPAFVRKAQKGWTSVYAGAAPLTAEVLRGIARDAGVALWSDRPDIVYGTRDAVTVIATAAGERTLTFPNPLRQVEGGAPSLIHRVTMEFGDVRVFIAPEA